MFGGKTDFLFSLFSLFSVARWLCHEISSPQQKKKKSPETGTLWQMWHEKASFLSPKHRFSQTICTLKSPVVCSGSTRSSISTHWHSADSLLCLSVTAALTCRATRRVRKHTTLHRVKRMSAHEDTWSFIHAALLTPAERCSSCGNSTST